MTKLSVIKVPTKQTVPLFAVSEYELPTTHQHHNLGRERMGVGDVHYGLSHTSYMVPTSIPNPFSRLNLLISL